MRMEFTDWSWWGWAFGYALQGIGAMLLPWAYSYLLLVIEVCYVRCIYPFLFSCSFTI